MLVVVVDTTISCILCIISGDHHQIGSFTSDRRKKRIRPREIALALISKLTLNSFDLKTVSHLIRGELSELIQSDFCTCPKKLLLLSGCNCVSRWIFIVLKNI